MHVLEICDFLQLVCGTVCYVSPDAFLPLFCFRVGHAYVIVRAVRAVKEESGTSISLMLWLREQVVRSLHSIV